MSSSGIPEFDLLFKIFDPYLTMYGLCEVYLRDKTTRKSFQMFQHLLHAFSIGNLIYANMSESLFLVFSAQDMQEEDFLVFSEILACNFCCYMAMCKCAALGMLRSSAVKLTDKLKDLYRRENNDEEKKIINNSIAPAKRLIKLYTVISISLAFVYNMFNLIYGIIGMAFGSDERIHLPYSFYYFFDPAANMFIYVFCYIMEMHAGFMAGCTIVTFDGFFCLVLTHLSMHFHVLCYNIRQIGVHAKDVSDEEVERLDGARIKEIVLRHTSLLEACDFANRVFGFPLLVNVTLASILNCALMFSISISPIAHMIKYILFMVSSFTQLFMVSYYGDKLKSASGEIAMAAYECNWCEVGLKIRKSLTIIMNKGLNCTSLSAFGFAEISMITFMSVLKVTMSYFTLLKTMYEKLTLSIE